MCKKIEGISRKKKKMPVGEIGKQREAEKHEGIKQKKKFPFHRR